MQQEPAYTKTGGLFYEADGNEHQIDMSFKGKIIDLSTEYIIDRGCVNFGVDSASPDMWYDKTYPCYSACAERGITHIENLCNLDKVIGKRFTFIGLPLKIRKGTGSPLRPVAILEE
jgi:kynurenine formamidase